jgi:hypothetical protein
MIGSIGAMSYPAQGDADCHRLAAAGLVLRSPERQMLRETLLNMIVVVDNGRSKGRNWSGSRASDEDAASAVSLSCL